MRFEAAQDPEIRRRLQATPTALEFRKDDDDRLVEAAGMLLDAPDDYRCLPRDIGATEGVQ